MSRVYVTTARFAAVDVTIAFAGCKTVPGAAGGFALTAIKLPRCPEAIQNSISFGVEAPQAAVDATRFL